MCWSWWRRWWSHMWWWLSWCWGWAHWGVGGDHTGGGQLMITTISSFRTTWGTMSHSRESSNAWKDLPVIPFSGELRFSISSLIHIIAITKFRLVNEIFQIFNGEILYPLYHIHELEEHIAMILLPDCGTALQSKEEQVILVFILKQNNNIRNMR